MPARHSEPCIVALRHRCSRRCSQRDCERSSLSSLLASWTLAKCNQPCACSASIDVLYEQRGSVHTSNG